jgi:hypothetical protein
VAVILAGGEPTEIVTGYGLLKTTEDIVPMIVQRRHAQDTAFVWAVALDGKPAELKVSEVRDGAGNSLKRSEALMVQVHGDQARRLLVNPYEKQVVAVLPDGEMWRSREALAIQ